MKTLGGIFKNLVLPVAIACVLAVGFAGCESANASFFPLDKSSNGIFGAPKNPNEVELFITQKPPYKYREVGIITFETFSQYNDEADVYRIMRERAAKAGVDGLIIMNAQEFMSTSQYLGVPPRGRGRGWWYYDRYGYPDMYRYRAMAIMKVR